MPAQMARLARHQPECLSNTADQGVMATPGRNCFVRQLPPSAIEQHKAFWLCLERLDLSRSGLTATAVEQLSKTYWPHLQYLDVSNNRLTASAIEQLTNAHWPHLKSLVLMNTSIDANAMTQLVGRRWPRLCALMVTGVAVGAPALRVLLVTLHHDRFTVQLTIHLQQ